MERCLGHFAFIYTGVAYFSANALLNVLIPLQGAAWGASDSTIGLVMGAYMFTTMFFSTLGRTFDSKARSGQGARLILLVNGAL